MKNKSRKLASSRSFSRKTDGGVTKTAKAIRLDAERERGEPVPDNILRWEDDGGPAFEPENPIHQPAEDKKQDSPTDGGS